MNAQHKTKKKPVAQAARHPDRALPSAKKPAAHAVPKIRKSASETVRRKSTKVARRKAPSAARRPSARPDVLRFDSVRPNRRAVDDHAPAPGAPGSIEQQLDMVEFGNLRGDEVTFSHGNIDGPDVVRPKDAANPMRPLDQIGDVYSYDMSESNREGDEMSGDGHSSGLEGEEAELSYSVPHISTGMPGDESREDEEIVDEIERHRMPLPGEEEGNEEDT